MAGPGEGPGGLGPSPYFQTKLMPQGPKNSFFRPPPYHRVWMIASPPPPLVLSEGPDPPLTNIGGAERISETNNLNQT